MIFPYEIQIIMVSYCRPNDFIECVSSILKNTTLPYHLSIIDNSCGKLNQQLSEIISPFVTIYRNNENLGKGASFKKWYQKIMINYIGDFFVSIDSDIKVPSQWLERLIISYYMIKNLKPIGLLAPIIMNNYNDIYVNQIKRNRLIMHKMKLYEQYLDTIYYNENLAGPLFIIDRNFYENVGGYISNQLYGNDDSNLCHKAILQQRFIGIVTDLEVLHLNHDSTSDYRQWKKKHLKDIMINKGHWD